MFVLNRVHAHYKLISMHILMKSDEELPEIMNESIYEKTGFCHKEDIFCPYMSPILGKVALPSPVLV